MLYILYIHIMPTVIHILCTELIQQNRRVRLIVATRIPGSTFLYDFISNKQPTDPSMPTVTLIVMLPGLFYGTQSQSEPCTDCLCPLFICVRVKVQGNGKWLSGLWRGLAQNGPGSATVRHMALGSLCLMKHIQRVWLCILVCICMNIWTVVNYLVSEQQLFWSWRIVPVPSLLVLLLPWLWWIHWLVWYLEKSRREGSVNLLYLAQSHCLNT